MRLSVSASIRSNRGIIFATAASTAAVTCGLTCALSTSFGRKLFERPARGLTPLGAWVAERDAAQVTDVIGASWLCQGLDCPQPSAGLGMVLRDLTQALAVLGLAALARCLEDQPRGLAHVRRRYRSAEPANLL